MPTSVADIPFYRRHHWVALIPNSLLLFVEFRTYLKLNSFFAHVSFDGWN